LSRAPLPFNPALTSPNRLKLPSILGCYLRSRWSRLHVCHAINFLVFNWLVVTDACTKYPCIHAMQSVSATGPDLGGQRGQLPPAPHCKGAPRDEMYLFQIKYSFEKFRNSEAIQEYNSILYSYVALSIKGPQQQLIYLQV